MSARRAGEQSFDSGKIEAPRNGASTPPRDLPHPTQPEGPVPIMLSPDAPVQTEAHPEPANAAATIARLQRLLTDAIAQRAALTESNAILFAESKHWYVEDGTGYCEACNLPRKNRRHSPRVAA